MKQKLPKTYGFTLIELLVVISIIAILLAITIANMAGARGRARDAKIKIELKELKNALRLYYNDFQIYPGPASGTNDIEGCGSANPPSGACSTTCSDSFAAGPTNCDTVYMKRFPVGSDGSTKYWEYTQTASGDDFCLTAPLENSGDQEIAASQTRCSTSCGAICSGMEYCQCAD